MRPIKFSKKEIGSAVLAACLAVASIRPLDPWVFIPTLVGSWFACVFLAYHHQGKPARRRLFVGCCTLALGFIAWRNLAREKSVLTMEAHMSGAWSTNAPYSEIDLDMKNPPGDAIQNLDLTISRASKKRIRKISQMISMAGNDCSYEPINNFSHYRVPLKGPDGSHLTLDAKEYVDEYLALSRNSTGGPF